jgi:uncharacterized protein YqjF (DUF2071 family)
MTNVALRGVPSLPWVSAFPELNVRTYVRVRERPGIYFFSLDANGEPYRLDIHHPPWPLQRARATIDRNTMAALSGIALPDDLPLLHFARRQDMVAWSPVAIE